MSSQARNVNYNTTPVCPVCLFCSQHTILTRQAALLAKNTAFSSLNSLGQIRIDLVYSSFASGYSVERSKLYRLLSI